MSSLKDKLKEYSDQEDIDFTVKRWNDSNKNWDTFIRDYPYDKGIPPWNAKDILENDAIEEKQEAKQQRISEAKMIPEITGSMRRTIGDRIDPELSRYIGNFAVEQNDINSNRLGGKHKYRFNRKSKNKFRKNKNKSRKNKNKSRKNKNKSRKNKINI